MDEWTLFAEDSPAKTLALQGNVLALELGQEVDFSGTPYNLLGKSKHKQSSWKMSQDFFQATKDAISESSSLNWPTQGMVILSGECWIRNSLEFPNAVVESSLSEVLLTDTDPRFSLSAKACEGILRRATRRGKVLPEQLHNALVCKVAQGANE